MVDIAIESPVIKIKAASARLIESPRKRIIHVLRRQGNHQFRLEIVSFLATTTPRVCTSFHLLGVPRESDL